MKIKAIPDEIKEFLEKRGGSSIFLKGSAGTGKTTLALQLMEEMADPNKSFYLSTRVSDESLFKQFPWLKEKEMRSKIIDSSKEFLQTLYQEEEKGSDIPLDEKDKIESARKFLKSIDEEGPPEEVDRTHLNLLDKKVSSLERVYDRIENVLPERSLLVVDSVEGLTHKYDIDPETFVITLQKDLVENSNTNLIMVLEQEKAPELEYLVDGVVKLNRYQLDERDVREIRLIKLRGTKISQPAYLMSLDGGRFTSFKPYSMERDLKKDWKSISNTNNKYSTGIEDLDEILEGGFEKGSYNVFEVKENVSNEEYLSITRPIFLNFLAQEGAVVAVLSGGTHPDNLRKDLTRFISKDMFDSRFRIVDHFSPDSDKKYMMALGGKNRQETSKIYDKHISEVTHKGKRSVLEYTGFDTLEYLLGNEIAIKDMLETAANTKVTENLGIGIIKHGLKITSEIKNIADNYFVIASINKTPCIYGIKPKTGMYAITKNEKRGDPHIKLVPIV
ncbi:MAG: gas vesicle protein GvpD P-loop domain-containing protein [Thermoplasmatota archaeon]